MAKKPQEKKRKAATLAPKHEAVLGTVAVTVQAAIHVVDPAPFSELVIELATLGLTEEPDKVVETSANGRLLDPKRPIETSSEGVHLFFDPPLGGAGLYGFQLVCSYNDAAETRVAKPKEEKEEYSPHRTFGD
jgi:hypothetical protein